jgi:TetR/AcrR family transcriptional repressor of mexJK operon
MSSRGRPKSNEKHDQILQAALEMFSEHGYERTSLDKIARAANVSKQTIYSHFDSKVALLKAAIEEKCREAMVTGDALDYELPPMEFLNLYAERFLETFCAPGPIAMNRLCLAEADRHPELGETYYLAGPGPVMQAVSDYLSAATKRGELRVENPEMAAAQFVFLLKGIAMDIDLFNLPQWPFSFQREEFARDICTMFLRSYQ